MRAGWKTMSGGTRSRMATIPALMDLQELTPAVVDPILRHVEGYFHRHGRPQRGAHILVALSGGPDSVALLATLLILAPRHSWSIGAAHVNYRFRGAESDDDEGFVRRLTRRWAVRVHCCHPRLPRSQSGPNVQAWARDVRYRFLDRTADRFAYEWTAVGHQLNDRAETVAAAFLDAGGTFALSGIPPRRGRIIRPLFDVTRDEVLVFLRSARIPYRRDSSNRRGVYQRNRIRAHYLPDWERANPAIVTGLARLGEQLWRQRGFLEQAARRRVERAVKREDEGRLILAAGPLSRYDESLDPFVLRELVARVGLDVIPRPSTVGRFTELRRRGSGNRTGTVEQGDLVIRRSKDEIAVCRRGRRIRRTDSATPVPRQGMSDPVSDALRLKTAVIPVRKRTPGDDRWLAQFDVACLDGPLLLRWPRPGDRYGPVGLKGTKKLMDLLADRGVPSFRRAEVPVLTDAAGILWPIGHPIAARARVTSRTRHILLARVVGGNT